MPPLPLCLFLPLSCFLEPLPPVAPPAPPPLLLTGDVVVEQRAVGPGQRVVEGVAQEAEAPGDDDAIVHAHHDAHLGVDIVRLRGEQGGDRGLGDHNGGGAGSEDASWPSPSFTRMLA